MKSKAALISCTIFLLMNLNSFSQSSIEIEGVYSANLSKLATASGKNYFNPELYHSFGIRGNILFKSRIYITTGLFLFNSGTSQKLAETTEDRPEGTGVFNDLYFNAQTLTIPIKVGYNLIDNKIIRFGGELGFMNGILLKQYVELKSESEQINLNKDYMISFNCALDFGIKIKEKLIIHLRPNFNYQLNENLYQYRLWSYGLDFGLGYKIK